MKLIKHIKFHITLAFFGLFLLGSCISEVIVPDVGENTITITIDVPASRAIGSPDDHAINRIDVLIFDAGGAYLDRVSPAFISDINATQKSFTVRVPKNNLDLVILANSRDRIDAIESSLVLNVTNRATVYALLTESLPAGNIWNAQPGSTIPMWGEVLNINATTTPATNVELIRALAKINVRFLNQTISDKLEITGVSLYNFHTNGYLASPTWNWGAPLTSTPSPTNISNKRTGFPDGVTFPASVIVNNQIIDEIFLFEVAPPPSPGNPTVANRVASTCLIIRGYFEGSTNPSYYRIDLRDDAGVFLGVIRNHEYDIIINSVTGAGANTGAIAYDSELINITAIVRAWDAGSQVEVDYGQYRMITSESRFTFLSEGTPAQSLNILSDHPGGWTVESGYPSWIILGGTTSSTNTTNWQTMTITCTSFNAVRTGEFFITTEGLRKRITVMQVPLSQPNPDAEMFICPNLANTISLGVASVPAGTVPNTITYRWERSLDNVTWAAAPGTNNGQNYTIAANTLTTDAYFRRVAIWNNVEVVTTPIQVFLPTIRQDIPDWVWIGARRWSTHNMNTPGVFTTHWSDIGRMYQFGTIGGQSLHYTSTDPISPAWNATLTSNNRVAWTTGNDPCILARSTSGGINWRMPTATGGEASGFATGGDFVMLANSGSQWLTREQAGSLGLGCAPGRLFGPNVTSVVSGGNVIPANFNPATMLWFPGYGFRVNSTGALNLLSDNVLYWTNNPRAAGTPANTEAFHLNANSFQVVTSTGLRNWGFNIRCVSDN
jgi:hypothetical protein